MKLIELNIGLSSKTQGELNFIEVLNALTGRGFVLISYRVVTSQCKDGEEICLAVKCEAPQDWQSQLESIAHKYGQDCIAIVGFIGHNPYDTFIPSLWVEPVTEESNPYKNQLETLLNLHLGIVEGGKGITELDWSDTRNLLGS